MNAVATFGVLVVGVLVELWAMPLEQQQRSADTVSWYGLYPASAVQKGDPVYYKNEANSIWSDCSKCGWFRSSNYTLSQTFIPAAGKTTDALKISYVEIYPSSPTRGQLFTVHAKAQLSKLSLSLVPRPPFQHSKRKGGLVNTIQHSLEEGLGTRL